MQGRVARKGGAGRRRSPRDFEIADEIRGRILDGRLSEGGMLPPYPVLLKEFGVGQSVLLRALEVLEGERIIERRRRSGCFISEGAVPIIRERRRSASVLEFGSASPDGLSILDASAFSVRRHVSVFISDSCPEKIARWKKVIEGYCTSRSGVRIRLKYPLDGEYDPSTDLRSFDIVHGTPFLLRHIGEERMVEISDLAAVDLPANRLIPPFQEQVCAEKPLRAIPFSLIPALFAVNETLEKNMELPRPETAKSYADLLCMVRDAYRQGVLNADNTYGLGSLVFMLLCDKAISLDGSGRYGLDLARFRKAADAFVSLCATRKPENERLDAKTWLSCVFTFQVERLKQQKETAWRFFLPPTVPGGSYYANSLMLGIRKDSPCLLESMSLAKHLCSEESQRHLCGGGDCISMRSALLGEEGGTAFPGISMKSIGKMLRSISLSTLDSPDNAQLLTGLYELGMQAQHETMTADEMAARAEVIYKVLPPSIHGR